MKLRRYSYEVERHGMRFTGKTFTLAGAHRRTIRLTRKIEEIFHAHHG